MNQKDKIPLQKAQNHSVSLTNKIQRKLKIYENQTHKAILFDIRQNFVSIWGTADVTFGKNRNQNTPYVQTSNFNPISSVINGRIQAKWLPERFVKGPWSKNKHVRPIPEHDYHDILSSLVDSKQLFSGSLENIEEPLANDIHESANDEIETDNNSETMSSDFNQYIEQYPDDFPLKIPDTEHLENGVKEIQKQLLIDKKTIEQIVIHLTSGRHILLAGPIGTGKTRLAELIPQLFWNGDTKGYKPQIYTASYEWNVHDVIGGIVPRMKDDNPVYQIQYGCVTETVQQSWKDKTNSGSTGEQYSGTWLIIDEFNRAELDRAFGQLFTSLESKKLLIPDEKTPTLKELKIPKDFRIIGTLNTSDKHYLFKLSDALKRRFAYVEVNSPVRDTAEQEIYFALLNALKELPPSVSSLIQLDANEKKLSENQSNTELVSAIIEAYSILSFVRMIKDMGPAILKSIYQTVLTGTQIKGYDDSILDIALHGNIVPQLEKIEASHIEILQKFCFDDLFNFLRKIYNSQDDEMRQLYASGFEILLKYLQIPEVIKLKDNFLKQTITDENWDMILEKWKAQKSGTDSVRNLSIFRTSLNDLKSTFEFL